MIVYFLHGGVRCPTCRAIEAYSEEALRTAFSDQFARGTIQWQVLDYRQPANQPLAERYQVIAPTVVVVQMENGVQRRGKNLQAVWKRVDDRDALAEYVRREVGRYLEDP